MSPRPVTKRIRLPLSVAEQVKNEARRQKWSISRFVARAIGRDLAAVGPRVLVVVKNCAGVALDSKERVLSKLLAGYLLEHGFSAIEPTEASGRTAEYRLEASIQNLETQLERKRQSDLTRLRVNSTLCVSYRVIDTSSGAELAGRNLAICRVTPPIVAGTTVGGDAVDRLLDEAAETIAVTVARSARCQ